MSVNYTSIHNVAGTFVRQVLPQDETRRSIVFGAGQNGIIVHTSLADLTQFGTGILVSVGDLVSINWELHKDLVWQPWFAVIVPNCELYMWEIRQTAVELERYAGAVAIRPTRIMGTIRLPGVPNVHARAKDAAQSGNGNINRGRPGPGGAKPASGRTGLFSAGVR